MLASAALLVRTIMDPDYVGGQPIPSPAVAFAISSGLCLLGLFSRRSEALRFSFYRDGLPPLAFSLCLVLAGFQHVLVWLLLAASVTANLLFFVAAGRHDSFDPESDRITLYFRWPF